jgi:hypothetical protein
MARDEALDRILKEMSEVDRDAFMELSYIAIMHDPEQAISMEHEKQEKLNALTNLIEFFEHQERYEECASLVKILNEIKKQ